MQLVLNEVGNVHMRSAALPGASLWRHEHVLAAASSLSHIIPANAACMAYISFHAVDSNPNKCLTSSPRGLRSEDILQSLSMSQLMIIVLSAAPEAKQQYMHIADTVLP